jgi:3-hydroxyisobutyryl-CoA hydrolase
MSYALPSEVEIAHFVRGSHKSGGDSGITLPELIARVEAIRPGKFGVKKKVQEVASRQCQIVDNKGWNSPDSGHIRLT